jgi:tetratricopeptide (TPR) repeat protein
VRTGLAGQVDPKLVRKDMGTMKTIGHASPLVAALFLAGCAVLQPGAPPEPVQSPAVVALLDQAQTHASAGQLGAAGASLERALRIEPRNPALWQELARVRLRQGQYRQAENLAAKSNSFAGDDQRLRGENWRIIGQARSKLGDLQGAHDAYERAEGTR